MIEVKINHLTIVYFRLAHHLCSSTPLVLHSAVTHSKLIPFLQNEIQPILNDIPFPHFSRHIGTFNARFGQHWQ